MSGISIGLGISQPPQNRKWWGDTSVLAYEPANNRYMSSGQILDESVFNVTRASTGFALNKAGEMITFQPNEPRITDAGLLIEPSATNMALHAEDFSHAYWTLINGASVSGNIVTFSGTSNSRLEHALPVLPTGVSHTFSFRARMVSGAAIFKVGTSSNSVVDVALTTQWTDIKHVFTDSRWPRISNFTGIDGLQIEIERWQVEEGTTATSYIPTTSAPVTRAADIIRADDVATALAGMTRGIIVLDLDIPEPEPTALWPDYFILRENGIDKHIKTETNHLGEFRLYTRNLGTQTSLMFGTIAATGLRHRLAFGLKADGTLMGSLNGQPTQTILSTLTDWSGFDVGQIGQNVDQPSQTLRSLAVIDEEPTLLKLQELSAL